MDWIASLEKRFGSWAIPNLGLYIILIQVVGVLLLMGDYASYSDLMLIGVRVKGGEWWRLLSFMMLPRTLSPIWLLIAFYVFYLISNAMERQWGTFRFNLFILIGYLLTVAMAVISPTAVITNTFFLGCVFLAFATLFPNFEFLLFFILPVKVKWLGYLTAAGYLLVFFPGGGTGDRLCVVAAFVNYALFFGHDFVRNIVAGQRRKAFQAQSATADAQIRHECHECGATEQSDPTLHFRYCSTCGKCFCENHIDQHEHE